MALQSFKDLIVWQKSMLLTKEIYKMTESLPKSEIFGLTSQMRRAAVSIPSNIAEGYQRKNLGEYIQFLSIAAASAAELETQMILSKEIYKIKNYEALESLLLEIQKMLTTLIGKLTQTKR